MAEHQHSGMAREFGDRVSLHHADIAPAAETTTRSAKLLDTKQDLVALLRYLRVDLTLCTEPTPAQPRA